MYWAKLAKSSSNCLQYKEFHEMHNSHISTPGRMISLMDTLPGGIAINLV